MNHVVRKAKYAAEAILTSALAYIVFMGALILLAIVTGSPLNAMALVIIGICAAVAMGEGAIKHYRWRRTLDAAGLDAVLPSGHDGDQSRDGDSAGQDPPTD